MPIPSLWRPSSGNVSLAHFRTFSPPADFVCADYIVYDVWLLVELVIVYFLFVETSGSSLEEMAAIIDGEEVRDTIIEAVARVTDGKATHQREDVMDDKKPHVIIA